MDWQVEPFYLKPSVQHFGSVNPREYYKPTHFKGIVSDSNNTVLWHKSDDTNKQTTTTTNKQKQKQKTKVRPISKFSFDSNFTFTNYAWLCALAYCSIDCVRLSLDDKTLSKNGYHFILSKWFLHNSFGEMFFLKESYNRCRKFKFWHFWEHPVYEIWEYAFKGSVNPEIVKNIARCNFLIITVMYIKVYMSGMERSQTIHFWYQIWPKMLIFWENGKTPPFW